MTIIDLATSSGQRIRTTVCSLCGDRYGEDYRQFSSHLETKHTVADLGLDSEPEPAGTRQLLLCDGGGLDPESFAIPTIEDLDAIRTDYNLSQKELSRRAGMESGRFHHILRNDVDPQTGTMRAFLEVLQDAEPRGLEDVTRTGPKPESSALTEELEETDANDIFTDGGRPELEFADEYIAPIIEGAKTATIRKHGPNLELNDHVTAVDEDGEEFATLEITGVASVAAVDALDILDVFHAEYPATSAKEVLDGLRRHYDDVGPSTPVDVYVFECVEHDGIPDRSLRADGGETGRLSENGKARSTCDRCGEKIEDGNFIPLDAVVHPNVEVCADCVKPGDEVVDV